MDASEITKQVESKEKEEGFDTRNARMDNDFDLWNLVAGIYEDTIRTKTKEHATDIEITSNKPRTFCDGVQAILSSADMQIMVRMAEAEGEDKRSDIGKLERLFNFALEKGDERLRRLLLPPLREQLIWYSLVRGWVAGRFLVYKDGNDVIFDFFPLDPRWLTYEVGADGFLWVAYKTFRSRDALADEYTVTEKSFLTREEKEKPFHAAKKHDNPVIDYWKYEGKGKIGNAVVCDRTFLKELEIHDLPSMPILVMPVTTRPPIANSSGTSQLEGYGESIFAPIRGVNAIRNRFVSMVATHAKLMAQQALINYRTPQGIDLTTTSNVPGGVMNLPMNENRLEQSPMKEISPTVIGMLEWLNSQIEDGTLPDIRMGTPPQSGTLQNLLQEAGNRVFNPQLRNLNYFYADICRLIEEQLLVTKSKVRVQTEEKRKYYETQVTSIDLKRPHIIKVEFTARTPWTQMDTAQIAQMLKSLGLPDGWIWENILKVQDPKGLADLAAIELFEHSPKGAMKRAVEALIETRGDIMAAQSLVRDMDRLEAQEQMAMEPEAPQIGGGI